jgi:xylan 1,4-beta-xylosidase
VLNVFRMMGMLGGEYVAVTNSGALPLEQVVNGSVREAGDVHAVATRKGSEVDVLLWNYHDDDVAAEASRVRLAVSGVPAAAAVRAREFLMDGKHSNAYAEWQKIGSPASPSANQFRALQRAAELDHFDVVPVTANGLVELPVTLERQGVMLIRLTW